MKPKVAFYWCASCGGCEETIVDLAENVLKVVDAVDIVFWPVAMDFKRDDVTAMPDKSIAVAFINGAIRSTEQCEMVEMLREKAQLVIAFGSCAQLGGIPGLANLHNRAEVMAESYLRTPSVINPDRTEPLTSCLAPEGTVTLPGLWDTVKTLEQVIDVDYALPGCPPPTNLILDAVNAILTGQLPPKGSVLAPDVALCEECPRRETKPEKPALKEFKRPALSVIDPDKCLLAQGFLCLGPVTRKGCGAVCTQANMPCTGCMGPTSRVADYGAKALSAVASLVDSNDDAEIARILEGIVDPTGTFYRYSLPASFLHRTWQPRSNGGNRQ